MINIDDRTGSAELLPMFPKGVATLSRLEYGDASFTGNGPEGVPTFIGIERKKIRDLISSMTSGRLSGHQLPGLLSSYSVVYLVVEGLWRPHPHSGVLEIFSHGNWHTLDQGSRRFMMKEVWNYLNTLEMMAGVHVRFTGMPVETAQLIYSLYGWWSADWEDHDSHLAMHKTELTEGGAVRLSKPTLVCRMAAELPGIGPKRAREVARHFDTVMEMVMSDERGWRKIPGISNITASKVVNSMTTKG